jgi:hypothetical protein
MAGMPEGVGCNGAASDARGASIELGALGWSGLALV